MKGAGVGSSDEDPYSLTASASSGSSSKLGPGTSDKRNRDFSLDRDNNYRPQNWGNFTSKVQQDSEDDYVQNSRIWTKETVGKKWTEDLYYKGLSARVPSFKSQRPVIERASRRDFATRAPPLPRGRSVDVSKSGADPTWLHRNRLQSDLATTRRHQSQAFNRGAPYEEKSSVFRNGWR